MADKSETPLSKADKAANAYKAALRRGFDIGDAEASFAMKEIAVWDDLTAAQSAKEELLVALREADSAIETFRHINPDWELSSKARQKIDALLTKHGA